MVVDHRNICIVDGSNRHRSLSRFITMGLLANIGDAVSMLMRGRGDVVYNGQAGEDRLDTITDGFGSESGGSFKNFITLMGTSADKTQHTRGGFSRTLSDYEIASISRNALVKRILDLEGFEATREGWVTKIDSGNPEESQAVSKAVSEYEHELNVKQTVRRALSFARKWGSSIIIVGADDGQAFSEPLSDDISTVRWLKLYSANSYREGPVDTEPTNNFGKPLYYTITPGDGTAQFQVHWTRVVAFSTDDGESVLHGMHSSLSNYMTVQHSIAVTASEFAVSVYKIKGLKDMINAGRADPVRKRVHLADFGKSVINALIIDQDNEEFSYQPRPVSGLGELSDRASIDVAANAGIPITLLFEVSPGGFGTGESEQRNFNDKVRSVQTDLVEPAISRIASLLAIAQDGGALEPESFSVSIGFNGLRTPTMREDAELHKLVAEYAAILVNAQIIDPDEAANSLFGSGKLDLDIKLDPEIRGENNERAASILAKAVQGVSESSEQQAE